jgi:uncharacterized protein (TIGR03034 family)
MLPEEPARKVSKEESAGLMFDEFRSLAQVYSFHGPYKDIITEMINHMQGNSGRPYSSPLLDRALKAQILNDHSEQSSLLRIKTALNKSINYEYGFIPLGKKAALSTHGATLRTSARAFCLNLTVGSTGLTGW